MDLVSHGDNNDTVREAALDYIRNTKNEKFAQDCLDSLSSCKCCWQHQDHRPEILMDFSLPRNFKYKLKDCTCSCRHFARMICREFPSTLESSEPEYHVDKKLKVSCDHANEGYMDHANEGYMDHANEGYMDHANEGYMEHEYEIDHIMFKHLNKSPNKPLFTDEEMKYCLPMSNQ
jgi:hypothetical protein